MNVRFILLIGWFVLPCFAMADEPIWVEIDDVVYGAKPGERGPIAGGDGYANIATGGLHADKLHGGGEIGLGIVSGFEPSLKRRAPSVAQFFAAVLAVVGRLEDHRIRLLFIVERFGHIGPEDGTLGPVEGEFGVEMPAHRGPDVPWQEQQLHLSQFDACSLLGEL